MTELILTNAQLVLAGEVRAGETAHLARQPRLRGTPQYRRGTGSTVKQSNAHNVGRR
jgi:hypothetical protein